MGWNKDIWTETQEVAFVGLLILSTVWHRTHTAYWEQRLMGNRTKDSDYKHGGCLFHGWHFDKSQ